MPAYLVRIIETRDLVGIFVADDEDQVQLAVDECTDVPDCEYIELPDGGVMWESPAVPVPLDTLARGDDDTAPTGELPWARASLTERWWNFVQGFEDTEWKPFCPHVTSPRGDNNSKPNTPLQPGRVVPFKKRIRL
jgi:hypothetical protein